MAYDPVLNKKKRPGEIDSPSDPNSPLIGQTVGNAITKVGQTYIDASNAVGGVAQKTFNTIGRGIGVLAPDTAQRTQAAAGNQGATNEDKSGTRANTPPTSFSQTPSLEPVGTTLTSQQGGAEVIQSAPGRLGINTGQGGTGEINFENGKALDLNRLDSLTKTIAKNADPAFQQRLAQEAALSDARYRDYFAKRDLDNERRANAFRENRLNQLRFAEANAGSTREGLALSRLRRGLENDQQVRLGVQSDRNIEQSKIQAGLMKDQSATDIAKARIGIQAQKADDAVKKSLFDFFAKSADKNTSPKERFSVAKTQLGDTLTPDIIKASLGELGSQLGEVSGDSAAFARLLKDNNFSDSDAQSIYNAYTR